MNFYKVIEDGYIVAIGTNIGGVEIEKTEYDKLMDIIRNAPVASDDYDYKLTTNLEWEKNTVYSESIDSETNTPIEITE